MKEITLYNRIDYRIKLNKDIDVLEAIKDMKTIRQTRNHNFVSIVRRIQTYFGKENLFFTFSPFKEGILNHPSTFGKDNIDKLERWTVMMQAKLFSENIDFISMTVRIFLPDKITIDVSKEKVEIPRKDIYHFGFTKDKIGLFDENETYENQNINTFTGEKLEHEEGLVYRSSVELYDFLASLKDKYDILKDELLEPIVINLEDL